MDLNKRCTTKTKQQRARARAKKSAANRRGSLNNPTTSMILAPPSLHRGSETKIQSVLLITSFSSITAGGICVSIAAPIAQSLQFYGARIGDIIEPRRFSMKGIIVGGQVNSVADYERNLVRIILCWGVAGSTFSTVTLDTLLGSRSENGMIQVLIDRYISLVTPGRDSTGYLPAMKQVSANIPLNGLISFFGGSTNQVSGRDLFLIMISDATTVPRPGFINGACVLEYMDH